MGSINNFNITSTDMPFGGVKGSEYDRRHAKGGFKEFVIAKAILAA